MAIVQGRTVLGLVVLRNIPQRCGRKFDGWGNLGVFRASSWTRKVARQGAIVERAAADFVYGSLDGKRRGRAGAAIAPVMGRIICFFPWIALNLSEIRTRVLVLGWTEVVNVMLNMICG
jgi:hypothetical protein